MPDKIKAPWTPDFVRLLQLRQLDNYSHPYTCGHRSEGVHLATDTGDVGLLVPTIRGWICPYCDYTQDWAFAPYEEHKE